MAFCKFCGKKLEDGEVCACNGGQPVPAPAAEPEIKAEAETAAAPEANTETAATVPAPEVKAAAESAVKPEVKIDVAKAADMSKKIGKVFLNILKAPATEGKNLVSGADRNSAIIFIGVQAVLVGIFGLFAIGKINSLISMGGSYFSDYKFSMLAGFFVSLLFSVIFSALLAGLVLGGAKVAKMNISLNQALAVVAVRAVAVLPLIVLSCVVFCINVPAGALVFMLGNVLALCFLFPAIKGIDGWEENKAVYLVFAVTVVFLLLTVLIMSKAVMLYVPASIKDDIESVMGYGSMLGYFM